MRAPHLATFVRVAGLAEEQWGLVTSKQAANLGVPAVILSRWTQQGALKRLAQGVYKVAGSPDDAHDDLRAAWLGLDPHRTAVERLADHPVDAVVSHWSAAGIHRLSSLTTDVYEFTVQGRRQTRRRDVRIHTRSTAIDQQSWTCIDGLPVTTVPRTIQDLTGAADLAAVSKHPADTEMTEPTPSNGVSHSDQVAWLAVTVPPSVLRAAVALIDQRERPMTADQPGGTTIPDHSERPPG